MGDAVVKSDAGLVAGPEAHTLGAVGSTPAPATTDDRDCGCHEPLPGGGRIDYRPEAGGPKWRDISGRPDCGLCGAKALERGHVLVQAIDGEVGWFMVDFKAPNPELPAPGSRLGGWCCTTCYERTQEAAGTLGIGSRPITRACVGCGCKVSDERGVMTSEGVRCESCAKARAESQHPMMVVDAAGGPPRMAADADVAGGYAGAVEFPQCKKLRRDGAKCLHAVDGHAGDCVYSDAPGEVWAKVAVTHEPRLVPRPGVDTRPCPHVRDSDGKPCRLTMDAHCNGAAPHLYGDETVAQLREAKARMLKALGMTAPPEAEKVQVKYQVIQMRMLQLEPCQCGRVTKVFDQAIVELAMQKRDFPPVECRCGRLLIATAKLIHGVPAGMRV